MNMSSTNENVFLWKHLSRHFWNSGGMIVRPYYPVLNAYVPVDSLPTIWKLQCQGAESLARMRIAYPTMWRILHTLYFLSLIICATFSIKPSKIGIWYLLFKLTLSIELASTLTLLFFATVMKPCWMNIEFVILSNILICPASSKIWVSISIVFCICSETRLSFCYVTLAPSLNSNFNFWTKSFPCLLNFSCNFLCVLLKSGDFSNLFTKLFTTFVHSFSWQALALRHNFNPEVKLPHNQSRFTSDFSLSLAIIRRVFLRIR